MELLELVSSHVTMPVIGVVLCALMVFTFGFRSPAQPPSFTFEENLVPEKRNKKRSKQAKVKSSANGNVKITDSSAEASSKATSESPKVRPVLPSKPKSESRKEVTQDLKGEKKLKVKKESGKGGTKTQNLQADDVPVFKKETEEGEWTTIQMSKKSKKPKPSKKESSNQRAEPAVEVQPKSNATPEIEVVDVAPVIADVSQVTAVASSDITVLSPEVTAVSPAVTSAVTAVSPAVTSAVTAVSPVIIAEVTTSPESDRIKNKKRKEKVADKNKSEQEENAVSSKPVPVEPHSEEPGVSKKKNKRDRKPAGETSPASSETVQPIEAVATEQKDVELTLTPIDAPELLTIEQTKPVQTKQKNAGKEIVQKEASQSPPDMQIRQPDKPDTTADESVTNVPSKATKLADVEPEVPPCEQQQPSPVAASQPSVGICFDEIGDAWVNTAAKSKKKKSRREN